MKSKIRLLCCLALASLPFGKASAQVVMTVDFSDLSAVKFTATGVASAIDYSNQWSFYEGIALLNFFTAPVNVQDIAIGAPGSSTLTDSANNVSAATIFSGLSSWNDAHPSFYPNNGTGSDVTLWGDSSAKMTFSISASAFYGEAVFDLSSSNFTGVFPSVGTTGDVVIWNGNGTLGTWTVIPEPSTYSFVAGLCALGLLTLRRRAGRKI